MNGYMNNISIKPRTAIFMAVAVLSLSLVSCKGRRASDMVPSGDTVEVVVVPASETGNTPDLTQHNDSIQHEI